MLHALLLNAGMNYWMGSPLPLNSTWALPGAWGVSESPGRLSMGVHLIPVSYATWSVRYQIFCAAPVSQAGRFQLNAAGAVCAWIICPVPSNWQLFQRARL
jgi:hypothetical protein